MVTAFSWLGIQLSLLQKGFILFGEALSPGKFGKNNGKKDENASWINCPFLMQFLRKFNKIHRENISPLPAKRRK